MPVTVLVVDDSPDSRALYGEYLEFCGFHVEIASDGEEAVQKVESARPAVIIMDLAMPKMDGWEAITRIRANPNTAAIPIVALSAFAFGDEPDRARRAGADLCLTKPCLPSQVGRVVRAMLLDCSMPPPDAGVTMPDEERVAILTWLLCGYPE